MNATPNDPRLRRQSERDDKFQLRMTSWLNPTDRVQRVTLYEADNERVVVEWAPGETKQVPSKFDSAIQRIDCHTDACNKGGGKLGGGWFCNKGHNGTIVGGLAPLLKNLGNEHELATGLDPDEQAQKEAEADRAAAAVAQQEASRALVTAQARVQANAAKVDAKNDAATAAKAAEGGETEGPGGQSRGRPTSRGTPPRE